MLTASEVSDRFSSMKTISFEQAVRILDDCSAVIWGNSNLCYPAIMGDEDDEYVVLALTDGDGRDLRAEFRAADNGSVLVDRDRLAMTATDGTGLFIIVLVPAAL